ncbi:distal tail protein Dit [Lacticaseibacillus suilingensis]|uniref:distal tail protein Dit n=1 Tax=Lacticaseibacillus suilingensis TaxID=2799577 RepID=UPI0022E88932|nr:distal tail protein Dit [Lacticaseibacillus suilingensis]
MTDFPIKSAVTVTYDGVGLDQWLTVSDIQRNVGQARTANLTKVGTSNGKKFQYISADESTVKVLADINYDLATKRRELARVLTKSEPKQLIFSDEPDKYYMAIVADQSALIEDQFHGEITVTFIVPDGVAHSLTTKTTSNVGSDGALSDEIIIQNDGTYPVYPVIEATMHSDNGVLTLINESNGGVLQFGNKSEIDGYTSTRPERVLNIGFDSDPGGKENVTASNYPNYNGVSGQANQQVGTMQFGKDALGGSAMIPVFSNSGVKYWGGPSRVFAVPMNSHGSNTGNLFVLGRVIFDTGVKAAGRTELTLLNGSSVVMEIVVRDSSSVTDQIVFEQWVGNQMVGSRTLPRSVFKNGQYYQIELYRFSSRLGFEISPVSKVAAGNTAQLKSTVSIPFSITNTDPIDGVGVWFERWQQTQHSIMTMSDLQFIWTDVEYWTDTENLYEDGDVLTVNTETRQILLNNVLKSDLDRYGNDWDKFKLDPGTNKITMAYSNFATTPTVQAEIREAYL